MENALQHWYLHLLLKHTLHQLRSDLQNERGKYEAAAKEMEGLYLPLHDDGYIGKLTAALERAGFRHVGSFLLLLSRDHPEETALERYNVDAFPPTRREQDIRQADRDLPQAVYQAITSWD